jgi:hypothetical protein
VTNPADTFGEFGMQIRLIGAALAYTSLGWGACTLVLLSLDAWLDSPIPPLLYAYVLGTGMCLGAMSGLGIGLMICGLANAGNRKTPAQASVAPFRS